ncbi:MAG TPA: hypothetical protein VGO93_24015 [Candidatus Xenobia bacterium]|jgi:hypothetical protein
MSVPFTLARPSSGYRGALDHLVSEFGISRNLAGIVLRQHGPEWEAALSQARDRLARAVAVAQERQVSVGVALNVVSGQYSYEEWRARRDAQKAEWVALQTRRGVKAEYDGPCRAFFVEHKDTATPLLFQLYGQQKTVAITAVKPYDFEWKVGKQVETVRKIDLLWACKARDWDKVKGGLTIDASVSALALGPVADPAERYPLPDEAMQAACESKRSVRFTLNDGGMFTGHLVWATKHNVKLRLPSGKCVVIFNHAVQTFLET